MPVIKMSADNATIIHYTEVLQNSYANFTIKIYLDYKSLE